jgi:hypothetical protein
LRGDGIIRKAAISYSAKLFRIHTRFLGNLIDLLHAFWSQFLGATVDKSTFVGILSGLAIVVDKLEFG